MLATDLLADESEPRTVIFRQTDDEHYVAVTYDHPEAADRAWRASRGYLDPLGMVMHGRRTREGRNDGR